MSSGLRQQDNNITGYEYSNICNQRDGCLSGARVMSSIGVMYSQPLHCKAFIVIMREKID